MRWKRRASGSTKSARGSPDRLGLAATPDRLAEESGYLVISLSGH